VGQRAKAAYDRISEARKAGVEDEILLTDDYNRHVCFESEDALFVGRFGGLDPARHVLAHEGLPRRIVLRVRVVEHLGRHLEPVRRRPLQHFGPVETVPAADELRG
jgi:hypothetical protein